MMSSVFSRQVNVRTALLIVLAHCLGCASQFV